MTVLLGAWMTAGTFVDGWAHNRPDAPPETFFTPWHGLLYSGFAACAIWVFWLVVCRARWGLAGRAAIPRGYGLGITGVVTFAAGGLGDMAWHTAFGIERDLAALLSPTHLALFIGAALVLSSPVRSAWDGVSPRRAEITFVALLPALLGLAFTASVAAFMNMYLWALTDSHSVLPARYFASYGARARDAVELHQVAGLAGTLVTNALLVGSVLLLLKRWRPPTGSVTVLLGVVGTLMAALTGFRDAQISVLPPLVAGALGDMYIVLVRPSPARDSSRRPVHVLATVLPVALWGTAFAAAGLSHGLTWPVELWAGALVWTAISGLGLSLLAAPVGVLPSVDRDA